MLIEKLASFVKCQVKILPAFDGTVWVLIWWVRGGALYSHPGFTSPGGLAVYSLQGSFDEQNSQF